MVGAVVVDVVGAQVASVVGTSVVGRGVGKMVDRRELITVNVGEALGLAVTGNESRPRFLGAGSSGNTVASAGT